jgi:acetylornithine deacetylase/succinyl-diaminopimelate desuccinylase-like protein
VTVAGRRLYPIQVAEKGFVPYRIHVTGNWGHGSMPRDDNAAVRAAAIVSALAAPEPARLTPVMATFFDRLAAETDGPTRDTVRRLLDGSPRAETALDSICDPMYARAARALLRDTISPNIIASGVKYNVIPGLAEITLDARTLPGTSEPELRARLRARLGDALAAACEIEALKIAPAAESSTDDPLYRLLASVIGDHDPDGVSIPIMVPFATDAKHTAKLGIPTYGFSPLRLAPEDRFLELFHGVDERVSLDALRWGLPVLDDTVRRFCG